MGRPRLHRPDPGARAAVSHSLLNRMAEHRHSRRPACGNTRSVGHIGNLVGGFARRSFCTVRVRAKWNRSIRERAIRDLRLGAGRPWAGTVRVGGGELKGRGLSANFPVARCTGDLQNHIIRQIGNQLPIKIRIYMKNYFKICKNSRFPAIAPDHKRNAGAVILYE